MVAGHYRNKKKKTHTTYTRSCMTGSIAAQLPRQSPHSHATGGLWSSNVDKSTAITHLRSWGRLCTPINNIAMLFRGLKSGRTHVQTQKPRAYPYTHTSMGACSQTNKQTRTHSNTHTHTHTHSGTHRQAHTLARMHSLVSIVFYILKIHCKKNKTIQFWC
jgi:hypothetical protein